ncbi:hypothetical protein KM043_009577 [Ampulex compressa]|nr:hypothetical protein KM043_009577 [Ampulex compressa]
MEAKKENYIKKLGRRLGLLVCAVVGYEELGSLSFHLLLLANGLGRRNCGDGGWCKGGALGGRANADVHAGRGCGCAYESRGGLRAWLKARRVLAMADDFQLLLSPSREWKMENPDSGIYAGAELIYFESFWRGGRLLAAPPPALGGTNTTTAAVLARYSYQDPGSREGESARAYFRVARRAD